MNGACGSVRITMSGRSATTASRLLLSQPPMRGSFFASGGYVQNSVTPTTRLKAPTPYRISVTLGDAETIRCGGGAAFAATKATSAAARRRLKLKLNPSDSCPSRRHESLFKVALPRNVLSARKEPYCPRLRERQPVARPYIETLRTVKLINASREPEDRREVRTRNQCIERQQHTTANLLRSKQRKLISRNGEHPEHPVDGRAFGSIDIRVCGRNLHRSRRRYGAAHLHTPRKAAQRVAVTEQLGHVEDNDLLQAGVKV